MGIIEKQKRTDIQALRALAVLAVVAYHLWPERLTGGFMGVDIFFVISGYLMTLTLMKNVQPVLGAKRRIAATGKYLSDFYARRIKRLLPAASVVLIATLGLVTATGNFAIITDTAKQVTASTLFVQNLFLANESVDYLSNNNPTAVQHFWSLSLEEQFYLAWPLLLLAILLVTQHLSIVYKKTRMSGAVIPVSLLVVVFFIYGYLLTKSDPSAAYFLTPARVWELIIGGLVAFLPTLKNHDLKLLLPWVGFAMIGYALYKWTGVGFPGWHALVPVVGTAFIIYGGSTESESRLSFTNLLKARPIQWIGDVSYSLYLWHWPLIILLPVLLSFNIEGQYSLFIKLGIFALSMVLAWLSFKFVEIPAQKLQLKKRWIYISLIVVTGGIALAGMAISLNANARAESRLSQLRSYAVSDESRCLGARAIQDTAQCGEAFGKKTPIYAQINEIDRYTTVISTGLECSIYHPTKNNFSSPDKYCVFGDTTAKQSIAILGDSHANQWINALDDIGRRNNIKFILLSSGDCSWKGLDTPECTPRTDFIKSSGLLDNVSAVLVAVWFRYDGDYPVQPTSNAIKSAKALTNSPVFLIQDIPPAGTEGGPSCSIYGMSCQNDAALYWAIDSAIERSMRDDLIQRSHVIGTRNLFCDTEHCYSFMGGLPVYQTHSPNDDPSALGGNSHITGTYSLTASKMLEESLRRQGALNPRGQ
jgi:peptidoglycan/LPS O-acetylase OafA/YrhL